MLARAGLDVVVHEAAERIGGGMRTDELTLPGFRHDVCSAIHPLAQPSPAFRGLDVEWIHSPAVLAHPLDEGVELARRGRPKGYGRALFAGCCAHSGQPVERVASVGVGVALLTLAHTVGWPFPRGGSQALADALAARLRELGGEIRTSSPVEEIPEADVVLCDTPPSFVGRSVRYGPGAFKLDWALAGPIPWRDERVALAATVHVGGSAEEVAASERARLGAPVRPPRAAEPVGRHARAGRPPHGLGVLPRPERERAGHDRGDRGSGRAVRSRLPRPDPRPQRARPGASSRRTTATWWAAT